ncbi:MAG TPA: tRNA (N6-isopentenyl adenosine(37)-C2)-methylthiotransferase MiaB [Acidobacteriota bacterium]|nr:tRNA (N6-isopentenyl adenosine(37)-C2)-methylthiotransferase MiaB [Acidobacteriota bacterium]
MARRYYIETFGCQMNEHDSEKIAGLLSHQGLVAAADPDDADLYILNTCSVREKAAQKVYSRLGEFKSRKIAEPEFTIGVVGCVAQQEGESMVERVPFVDLVVGTHLYHEIPDLLEQVWQGRSAAGAGKVATKFLEDKTPVEIPSVDRASGFRANITIMEGCNKRCSFCVVPFTRGRERNRPSLHILEEAKKAAEDGFVEVLLLGQTVNSYKDPSNPRFKFAELLAAVAEIPGIRRVRFTSPHPRDFGDEAIEVIASYPNICNQIHLPLQSGSNSILKRMRRQYTRGWFLELVGKFKSCGRPIAFSTDVIVGFPGETEDDFQQTLEIVSQVGFESMFSFKYSPRPYTEALPWDDDVAEQDKTRRLMMLQRMQKGIQLDLHKKRYLGREMEILVEGLARDGQKRFGRTASGKVVNFEGDEAAGEFVSLRITDVGPNSLKGERLAPAAVSGGQQRRHHGTRV